MMLPITIRKNHNRTGYAIRVLVAAAVCLLTTLPAVGQASDETAIRKMLESRDAEIKQLLVSGSLGDKQREELKDVINGVIDFTAMGKVSLGSHWNGLSESQRNEFVDVFSDIVRAQSVSDLEVYKSKVVYKDIQVEDGNARVETVTTFKEVDTPVVYTMHAVNDEWRVTDIILDDVSTAEGYARSFQSLIRKRGFDVLMEKLRARRADEESA